MVATAHRASPLPWARAQRDGSRNRATGFFLSRMPGLLTRQASGVPSGYGLDSPSSVLSTPRVLRCAGNVATCGSGCRPHRLLCDRRVLGSVSRCRPNAERAAMTGGRASKLCAFRSPVVFRRGKTMATAIIAAASSSAPSRCARATSWQKVAHRLRMPSRFGARSFVGGLDGQRAAAMRRRLTCGRSRCAQPSRERSGRRRVRRLENRRRGAIGRVRAGRATCERHRTRDKRRPPLHAHLTHNAVP
jgi:hypothetical protein